MSAKDISLKALLDITAITSNAVANLNEKKKNKKPYTPYKPDYISTDGWKEGNNPWNTLSDYGGGSNSNDDDVSSDPFIVENEEYRDDGSGESQNYFDRHEGERDEWWDPNSKGNKRTVDDDEVTGIAWAVNDHDVTGGYGGGDKEPYSGYYEQESENTNDIQNKKDAIGNTLVFDSSGDLLGKWSGSKDRIYVAFDDYSSIKELNELIKFQENNISFNNSIAKRNLGEYYDLKSYSDFYITYGQSTTAAKINGQEIIPKDKTLTPITDIRFNDKPLIPKAEVCAGLVDKGGTLVVGNKIDKSDDLLRGYRIAKEDALINTHSITKGTLSYEHVISRSTTIKLGPNDDDYSEAYGEKFRQVTIDDLYIYIFNSANSIQIDRKNFSYIKTARDL